MYNHRDIEKKWREKWNNGFVSYRPNPESSRKRYILVEFPFPSGSGLHVGHTKSYMALDIRARKYRMEGDDVLYPMGWDAFGLPTENYAITHGIHPRVATQDNIKTFRNQIDALGISFDWSKEINTTDPAYYKWTQWIFMQMFKKGLAYQDTTQVWWCPELKTVLANEEVIDGKSERGGYPCERKPLRQWMLAITKYAQRLHDDLDTVEYLDIIKRQQRNWIGMSTGARVTFPVEGKEGIEVYTTRPDTLFGVTFLVLAPEHPLVTDMTTNDQQTAVQEYQAQAGQKTDLDRQQQKIKTGVFTGGYATHPLTGEFVPVWVADYVLVGYGTGAIMAVPAHDERDLEFAHKYDIPVIEVISENGSLINSQDFDGQNSETAKETITESLSTKGYGVPETQSKLRDWVFSRQRYWGEPFPIVWVSAEAYNSIKATNPAVIPKNDIIRDTDGVAEYAVTLIDSELPLTLPDVESYIPQGLGEGPLALATDWVKVWYQISTGKTVSRTEAKPGDDWVEGTRETDTMPNWAGSSWYFLRYIDPTNTEALASPDKIKTWMPVDIYNGGMEHTTLHLLYSRFWYKFLYDIGVVPTSEPYYRRISHGMILAEGGIKMSKSKGNTINPLEMCDSFGADALRCYIMFMGPYDEAIAWDTHGLVGCHRFLTKVYYWAQTIIENPSSKDVDTTEVLRDTHALIQKVSNDIEAQKLNTCVSSFMEYLNTWGGKTVGKDVFETFLTLLAPFAPHLTEELWEQIGHTESIHTSTTWPEFDDRLLVTTEADFQVHVNGKMRAIITVGVDTSEDIIAAKALEAVSDHIEGKTIKTQKVIRGKNIVIVVVG